MLFLAIFLNDIAICIFLHNTLFFIDLHTEDLCAYPIEHSFILHFRFEFEIFLFHSFEELLIAVRIKDSLTSFTLVDQTIEFVHHHLIKRINAIRDDATIDTSKDHTLLGSLAISRQIIFLQNVLCKVFIAL